jgi:alpha-L-arabinofuranosidase
MRNRFCAIICSILALATVGCVNAATLLHYNFEDGTPDTPMNSTGTTGQVGSADLSGNDHHMRAYNAFYGPSFSVLGDTPTGEGLSSEYNGSQDGYTTTSINSWSPSVWTIELAFKLDSTSGWCTLIGRDGWSEVNGDTIDSEAAFYLQKNNVGGAIRLNFATLSGERYRLDSSLIPTSGQWYYFAATCDGSEVRMYADSLDGSGYQPVGTFDLNPGLDHSLLATGNWTFGRGWWNGNLVDKIIGNIDDVRFSDVVLSTNQLLGYRPVVFRESGGKTLLYKSDTVYTDSYDVSLLTAPTSDVIITVTPPAGIDAGSGSGLNHTLTFTTQNWSQAQTVTLRIGDPQVTLGSAAVISHTCQSDDANYDQLSLGRISASIVEETCGIWGYLETDYNFDCTVNLEDFSRVALLWLDTEAPLDVQSIAEDWLAGTLQYDELLFARSIQDSDRPFYVNTAVVENTIDEKVYGHFYEHIYHSANGGLWGELVWNRSFEMAGSGGLWMIDGSELVQSSSATDVTLQFGDAAWQNYELTLQAQKTGGSEGFLILFRCADSDNFYWLNLGGWNNTQHAVEKEVNGGRSTVAGTSISGSINTGQWYDIRVRCQGGSYTIDLNDNPIMSFTDSSGPHLAGKVGVGTWATQARFRNIQVTRIEDSAVLFSGLPDLPAGALTADFWMLHGPAQAAISTDALNDDYSVLLTASAAGGGVQQDNFKFIPQLYTGSLWMKGSAGAGVKVELLDGSTVLGQATLPAPTNAWVEYPFQIASAGSTDWGSFRITLQGAGTIHLDQVSLLGQDAIDTGGYRPDLLEAVEGLRPPVIRWPGGCFSSAYFWKDGIGPQHQRRKYPINLWDDQDTNSYGTDEFLRMCERIGAEPLICFNTGLLTGTCGVAIPYRLSEEQYVQDALDWMEYCNGSVETTWGAVRAANGHPEPYNVKYWEIDNETWSTGYGGGITNYIATVQLFAPAMQAKANELGFPIELIAVGGGSYDMNWNRTLIDACGPLIDYISVHHYEGSGGYKTGPANYDHFLTELADYIAGSLNPNMKIYNSEWNLQTTDWRTGLFAGGILNVYERHGANFKIGGPALFLRHTSATGWDNAFINFDHTGWFAAPNYVVMKLWYDHFAPNRVRTDGTDTDLNVVSTLTDDGQTLYLKLVNADASEKTVEYEIDASFIPESAYMHYVAPGSLYARNTLANPSDVYVRTKVVGFRGQTLRFKMPAYSAGVITVETTQPHKTRYLYSSFRDNGQDGLHLAYSEDGLTWTALKNDQSFLAPQIGGNLMRDPSICQGPDGMFHMVWTTGWWDKGIGLAHSSDLINWSQQTFLPVMAHEPNAKNCWAPEIFYDETTRKFLIFWSTTIDGAFPETYNPNDDNNHRIYYVSTQDFVTYSPTQLLYDPGFNCIDAFIAKEGGKYVMFIKHESKAPVVEKNIRIAYSDHAEGPWGPASASISPAWVEGPSALKIGHQWMLYYDGYTRGRMEGQSSSDLDSWTDLTGQLSFPPGTRHGTIIAVSEGILGPLLSR